MSLEEKLRAAIRRFKKVYSSQGWWPRLVRRNEKIMVTHHADDRSEWIIKDEAGQAFEVALGAILVQNTSWQNAERALIRLATDDLLFPEAIGESQMSSLEAAIRSAGYFRQKAKKLKIFSSFVANELKGDLRMLRKMATPRARLLDLWGIGPETADTILLFALELPIFVIDAYTRRLFVKLTGDETWLKRPYDELRARCEAVFPISVKHWQDTHALIVRWGKDSASTSKIIRDNIGWLR